jgi:hypothetical protein
VTITIGKRLESGPHRAKPYAINAKNAQSPLGNGFPWRGSPLMASTAFLAYSMARDCPPGRRDVDEDYQLGV